MPRSLATVACIGLASAACAVGQTNLVQVTTSGGVVEGVNTPNGRYFRGMRYAAPPVGDLRWRRPADPPAWTGVYNATQFGADCLQYAKQHGSRWEGAWYTINGLEHMSEDCLFVNVVTPPLPNASSAPASASHASNARSSAVASPLWPVLVYFHAGEFYIGAGNDLENNWPYDAAGAGAVPSPLLQHGVVIVTLNYRLGHLGWLAADELRGRDPKGSTGNYGAQDQRQALRWVQKNIAAFGGDPNNVILQGESSGGTGVSAHLAMRESWGLFHKVIMESPGFTQVKPYDTAYLNAKYLAMYLALRKEGAACQLNAFGGDFDTPGAFVEYPLALSSGIYLRASYPTVRDAVNACAANKTCFGVTCQNETAKGTVAASFSTSYALSHHNSGVRVPGLASYIRGANMTLFEDCLMSQSAELLSTATIGPFSDTIFENLFGPVPDGVEFNVSIVHSLLREDLPPNISYLVGSNLDEGTEFLYATAPIDCNATDADLEQWAKLTFPTSVPSIAEGIVATYANVEKPVPECPRPGTGALNYVRATRAVGDCTFLCLVRALGNRLLTNTSLAVPGSAVYNYYWTHQPLVSQNMGSLPVYGAFHGSEVPFVFGYPAEIGSDEERNLSSAVACYWANFAHSGNPILGPCDNSVLAPAAWTRYRQPGDSHTDPTHTLILDVASAGGIRMATNVRADICELYAPLWNSSVLL